MMRFTVQQLIWMGLHVGHTYKKSVFLAAWSFYGWRYNLFMHDMVKSIMKLKIGIKAMKSVIALYRPIWYVMIKHIKLSALVVSYSVLAGESFCSYNWMAGSVTNFKSIWGWNNVLLSLSSSLKYNSSFKDKKKLFSFSGLLNTSSRMPGLGFVPSPMEDFVPTYEFFLSAIPCMNISDSDCVPANLTMPIFGNDDSFICVNFITFFLTKIVFVEKVIKLKNWRVMQRRDNVFRLKLLKKMFLFDLLAKKNSKKKNYKFESLNLAKKQKYLSDYSKIFKYEKMNAVNFSYWKYVETIVPNVNVIL